MENFGQLFYKATRGKTFQCVKGNYHGMETYQWTWNFFTGSTQGACWEMDEVKNAIFSFENKSYIEDLLLKVRVKERAA